jgi:hypothetical protein
VKEWSESEKDSRRWTKNAAMITKYRPELDISPELDLDDDLATPFQQITDCLSS